MDKFFLSLIFCSGFESNVANSKYEVYARIPRVEMIAKYIIDGRVLVLPITGNGKSNLTMGIQIFY